MGWFRKLEKLEKPMPETFECNQCHHILGWVGGEDRIVNRQTVRYCKSCAPRWDRRDDFFGRYYGLGDVVFWREMRVDAAGEPIGYVKLPQTLTAGEETRRS